MRSITIKQVEKVLTARLGLKDPEFHLRRDGPFINGAIVSPTFQGKRDRRRLSLIWDALDAEWGKDSRQIVGMLIAYIPQEWQADDEPLPVSKLRTAKVG